MTHAQPKAVNRRQQRLTAFSFVRNNTRTNRGNPAPTMRHKHTTAGNPPGIIARLAAYARGFRDWGAAPSRCRYTHPVLTEAWLKGRDLAHRILTGA